MRGAYFIIHPDLRIFLPRSSKEDRVRVIFNPGQTTKHLIESIGIPHTEIGQLLHAGKAVSLHYQVQDEDVIEVLPPAISRRDESEDEIQFVIDNHLGQLSTHMRMLGFDCLYRNDYDDEQLSQIASQDNRILLTRDRHLLMRKQIQRGYWVRSKDPLEQTREVLLRYDLLKLMQPFTRCMECNGMLNSVPKEQILDRLLPLTKKYFTEFSQCTSCGQVYWKGSHHDKMVQMVEELKTSLDPSR